ncbi:MAG: fenitrothion hydrolase [Solirubrobacterales bacterium]
MNGPPTSPSHPRRGTTWRLAALVGLLGLMFPAVAQAHAVVAREDLPLPTWLFFWGGALVLIVSFAALSQAWQEPRLATAGGRTLPGGLSSAVGSTAARVLGGVVGVALLALTIYAGLSGVDSPAQNFAVTFVFVTFWLGVPVFSVLFGNVFRALNPWRAVGNLAEAGSRALAGGRVPPPLLYPDWLGRWPAALGLFGFLWFELVYTGDNVSPSDVAGAAVLYTIVTVVAMAAFGTERWMNGGETFATYFRMLSFLSPLGFRDGRLRFRVPLSGMGDWMQAPGSVALVLVAIGGTAYDGATEGPLAQPINDTFRALFEAGFADVLALRITGTIFLLLSIGAIAAIYWIGVRGMRTVDDSKPLATLGRAFAHSLIPIALAYLVAHYFTLFLFQEQAQFTYLLSDPLGEGADIFGTAGSGIDYSIIGASTVWYVQVGALVIGHVAGLIVAHDRALEVFGDADDASRSQYWMLTVMVIFTTLGLYLLSQANQ